MHHDEIFFDVVTDNETDLSDNTSYLDNVPEHLKSLKKEKKEKLLSKCQKTRESWIGASRRYRELKEEKKKKTKNIIILLRRAVEQLQSKVDYLEKLAAERNSFRVL